MLVSLARVRTACGPALCGCQGMARLVLAGRCCSVLERRMIGSWMRLNNLRD